MVRIGHDPAPRYYSLESRTTRAGVLVSNERWDELQEQLETKASEAGELAEALTEARAEKVRRPRDAVFICKFEKRSREKRHTSRERERERARERNNTLRRTDF